MIPIAASLRRALFAILVAAPLLLPGCALGYISFAPGENSALYHGPFADVITSYDDPHWLWIRGAVDIDINGDGKMEEEAVIATIQEGSHAAPGPIKAALLAICTRTESGDRVAMARTLLFQDTPFITATRPTNDVGLFEEQPLTRVRAQVVQDKVSFAETIVVYFWGDARPTSAWYAGFRMRGDRLEKILDAALMQNTPGILVSNLDKSREARNKGYQLITEVAAIPDAISAKIGPIGNAPKWGHVFSRNDEGCYEQADARFREHYRKIEGMWNQAYLRAIITDLPDSELAWYEYHLALMNFYTGNADLSDRFLAKAEKYAEDKRLRLAIMAAERATALDQAVGGGE